MGETLNHLARALVVISYLYLLVKNLGKIMRTLILLWNQLISKFPIERADKSSSAAGVRILVV